MNYRRLPGKRWFFWFNRSSLWLGEDHLLLVKKRGYAEEYKRFYYRDIQALIVTPTNVAALISGILILFAAFPSLLFIAGYIRNWGRVAMIIWGSIAAFLLILWLINRIRGSTCRAEIQTAVQIERLTSLSRLRMAKNAIDRILPFIQSAQASPVISNR